MPISNFTIKTSSKMTSEKKRKKIQKNFFYFFQKMSPDFPQILSDQLRRREMPTCRYPRVQESWLFGSPSKLIRGSEIALWKMRLFQNWHFPVLIVQFLRSPIKFVEFSRKVTRYDALINFSRDCLTQLAPRGQMGGFKKSIENFQFACKIFVDEKSLFWKSGSNISPTFKIGVYSFILHQK